MLTGQALEIVLGMARKPYRLKPMTSLEVEALEEIEFLLTSFDDGDKYNEEDFLDDK